MRAPTLRGRFLVAACFALVAGSIAWRLQYVGRASGGDYFMIWRATRLVLAGNDPYQFKWWSDLRVAQTPFYYPLPAIGMGLPFVWLKPQDAAIAFATLSAGLLGFVLTRHNFDRVPMVLSVPFIFVAHLSQTTCLILALALVPGTAWLSTIKPNIALALFAWRPRLKTVLLAGGLFAGTVIVAPWWPAEWLAVARSSTVHNPPVATGIGFVMILVVLRWRRPEARLLLVMSLVPHALYFYDELPLWLIARSRRESMVLVASSWIGGIGWAATSGGPTGPLHITDTPPWVVASLYIPSLLMVLARPNEGEIPAWLQPATSRLPRWLRGTAPAQDVSSSPEDGRGALAATGDGESAVRVETERLR